VRVGDDPSPACGNPKNSVRGLGQTHPRMSSATILGVTGIVVSGVVGPLIALWGNRNGDRRRHALDAQRRQHEDLQAVVDDGAVLLGAGETNLRLAHEAVAAHREIPTEVAEWSSRVHLLGQRLLLRLPADDPIVTSYEGVRAALLELGGAYGDEAVYPRAVNEFDARRSAFLAEARAALERTRRP